jgi:histidine triad (HIT) family protein
MGSQRRQPFAKGQSAGQQVLTRQVARRTLPGMSKTLFEKIIAREIPAAIVYEDDLVLAFKDVKPQAPVHVLIVPKQPIPRVGEAKPEDHKVLGHLLIKAGEVARSLGLEQSGFRLVFNNGPDAGEAVPHLHCHILGGRPMNWPPG